MMNLYVSFAGIFLLSIALANPFPQGTFPPTDLAFVDPYETSTTGFGDELLGTEDSNRGSLDSLILAKQPAELGCANGLGFACCDSHWAPYYGSDGNVMKTFGVLGCGPDVSKCQSQPLATRNCCEELDGNLPDFSSGKPARHYLICAKGG